MAMMARFFVHKFTHDMPDVEESVMLLGVADEFDRFVRRLSLISALLLDAEERAPRDPVTDLWLSEIRDLMYDADDIIDECKIEGERLMASPNSSSSSTAALMRCCVAPFCGLMRNSFPAAAALMESCVARFCGLRSHRDIGKKVKSLNAQLDEIIKEKNALGFRPIPHDDENRRCLPVWARTLPLFSEPDVVGGAIEEDTRVLVELLIEDHPQKISIVAITGMGGIGKTFLAQKVFNDEKLQDHFRAVRPIWVCASQDFNEIKLLREIVEGLGGSLGYAQDRAELELILHNIVRDKKIFLVLDDVWDPLVWENLLRKPLQSCGVGSRILITTRNQGVAKQMGARHLHPLEPLSPADSWSLFKNSMLLEHDEDIMPELRDIGMKIVEKCHGHPLAVRTIAGVLRTRDMSPFEWEYFHRNLCFTESEGVWEALHLSYRHLPFYLKPCFVYFSLFPADSVLRKDEFEQLWKHEGFVEPLENQTMEETASKYWQELAARSFLQTDPNHPTICHIHDLLLDFARFAAQEECFCGDIGEFAERFSLLSSTKSIVKPRRLYINDEIVYAMPDLIKQQTSLRTLICHGILRMQKDDFTSLRLLRILDLSSPYLEELPYSIGELIHLRYLKLSGTKVKEIPESIENLKNLRHLDLSECRELALLPKGIIMLNNLEVLYLKNTVLSGMPRGMRNFKNLKELDLFIAQGTDGNGGPIQEDTYESSTLEDLGHLSELTTLSIDKLERVSDSDVARAATLRVKRRLSCLTLGCTRSNYQGQASPYHRGQDAINNIREVFEELCPPISLTVLKIDGYFGLVFPRWMRQLPQLKFLSISNASHVTNIGPELFFSSDISSLHFPSFRMLENLHSFRMLENLHSFPMLENLHFIDMPNWKEWRFFWGVKDEQQPMSLLPRLKMIKISGCPKLMSLPEDLLIHATNLTELNIEGADSLKEIKSLHFLEKLDIRCSKSIETVSDLPRLETLHVSVCRELKNVKDLDALQQMELDDPSMEFLPEWLVSGGGQLRFNSMQTLKIQGSTSLLSRCLVDGKDWLKIRDIPRVRGKTKDGSAYISYTKEPFFYDTNLQDNYEDLT